MQKFKLFSLSFLILSFLFSCSQPKEVSREISSFGNDWNFRLENAKDSVWNKVNLPHSAKIEPLVVNDQWQGNAEYKKSFRIEELDESKVFFYFDLQKATSN